MSSLRITAGSLRGRRVLLPKGDLRPTSERARQAWFNIIGSRISGARFLDLFAGSGIFSFEAVSRGAKSSVAIEISAACVAAIERHAREWHLPISVIRADVLSGIKLLGNSVFDLVYADPPYEYDSYDKVLLTIDKQLHLADDAVIAIEHRRRTDVFSAAPERLRFMRRAEYGEVWISLFTNSPSDESDDEPGAPDE
jgi:16S rRNA (guanine966-N2)-methyltransferase